MTEKSVAAALAVMDAHISALNDHNEQALAKTLHFPHYRISGTELRVWNNPDHYFRDFRSRAGSDWHRSLFNDIKVIQSSEEKVHLDAEIQRYRENGTLLNSFRSLWVITQEQSESGTRKWAAKFRSSFAQR